MIDNPLEGLIVPEGWTLRTEKRDVGDYVQCSATMQLPEGKSYSVSVTRLRNEVVYYEDQERLVEDTWQQVKAYLAQRVMDWYGDPERQAASTLE